MWNFYTNLPARCLFCALFLVAILLAHNANALKFLPVADNTILLIYDCGHFKELGEPKSCAKHETKFSGPGRTWGSYPGDAAILDQLLRKSKYSQIFLWSGGGNLEEGIKVGEVLRKYNQFVVVAKGMKCVSACTVAFLGGRVRDVDPDGSYEVHAYSAFLELDDEDSSLPPNKLLDVNARRNSGTSKRMASRLLAYMQRMIGGEPNQVAAETILSSTPDFHTSYLGSPLHKSDLQRIATEGDSARQEVLMRLERDAFEQQLSALRININSLGRRAINAIEMLEIMFSSRITATSRLDQNTLREKGYINVRRQQ